MVTHDPETLINAVICAVIFTHLVALLQQCTQATFNGETFGDAVMALQVSQNERLTY